MQKIPTSATGAPHVSPLREHRENIAKIIRSAVGAAHRWIAKIKARLQPRGKPLSPERRLVVSLGGPLAGLRLRMYRPRTVTGAFLPSPRGAPHVSPVPHRLETVTI